jgi:gluconate 2-dehydrogenase gamma chain
VPPAHPESLASRRDFIASLSSGLGSAWLAALWPAALADAAEAGAAAARGEAPRYLALTAAQANEFGAVADRIIPPDETPGARAAGVVNFADRMLASIGADQKPAFDKALIELSAAARARFPKAASFSALGIAQQDEVLTSIEKTEGFGLLRTVTVAGFLSHPSHGGNRDGAGWKTIGLEDRMSWQSPFGYYDRPEVMARLLPPKRT